MKERRSDADGAAILEEALGRLRDLQSPGGTFRSGDNVDSPPDSAFTLNDLAWARRAIEVADDEEQARHQDGRERDRDDTAPDDREVCGE